MLKVMSFFHLIENLGLNIYKKINRCCKKKTGIDVSKTASKRVVKLLRILEI